MFLPVGYKIDSFTITNQIEKTKEHCLYEVSGEFGKSFFAAEFFPDGLCERNEETGYITPLPENEQEYKSRLKTYFDRLNMLKAPGNTQLIKVYRTIREDRDNCTYLYHMPESRSLKEYLAEDGGKRGYKQAYEMLLPMTEALARLSRYNIFFKINEDNLYVSAFGSIEHSGFMVPDYNENFLAEDISAVLYYLITGKSYVETLAKPSETGAILPLSLDNLLFENLSYNVRYENLNEYLTKIKDSILFDAEMANISTGVINNGRKLSGLIEEAPATEYMPSISPMPEYTPDIPAMTGMDGSADIQTTAEHSADTRPNSADSSNTEPILPSFGYAQSDFQATEVETANAEPMPEYVPSDTFTPEQVLNAEPAAEYTRSISEAPEYPTQPQADSEDSSNIEPIPPSFGYTPVNVFTQGVQTTPEYAGNLPFAPEYTASTPPSSEYMPAPPSMPVYAPAPSASSFGYEQQNIPHASMSGDMPPQPMYSTYGSPAAFPQQTSAANGTMYSSQQPYNNGYAPPPPPSKKSYKGLAIGCGLGCLAIVVIMFIMIMVSISAFRNAVGSSSFAVPEPAMITEAPIWTGDDDYPVFDSYDMPIYYVAETHFENDKVSLEGTACIYNGNVYYRGYIEGMGWVLAESPLNDLAVKNVLFNTMPAYIVAHNDYLYYCDVYDDYRIYRMYIGEERNYEAVRLNDERSAHIRADDNYVYYVNLEDREYVYSVNNETSETELLISKSVYWMADYYDRLIYSADDGLYAFNKDSGRNKKLNDSDYIHMRNSVDEEGGYIYYMDILNDSVKRLSIDGQSETEELLYTGFSKMDAEDGYLYYINDIDYTLSRMNLETMEVEDLGVDPQMFSVSEGYLLYLDYYDDSQYILNLKSGVKTELYDGEPDYSEGF